MKPYQQLIMTFLSQICMRGSLRSSHTIRQNIRSNNNTRLFIENRFFHSQRNVRPSLQNKALKSPSGGNLFWHYLNAPGNMLFLTTNFIGLGILVTYRCFSSVAVANRTSQDVETNILLDNRMNGLMNFDSSGDRFNLLKQQIEELKKEELKLSALEEEYEEEDILETELKELEQEEEDLALMTSRSQLNEEEIDEMLPYTEIELDEYGPPLVRDVKDERFKSLLISQLLSSFYVNDFLGQIFRENEPDLQLLETLSTPAKESLVLALYGLLERQNDGECANVDSFKAFFDKLPVKEIKHFIEDAFANDLRYQGTAYNNTLIKDEYLENSLEPADLESLSMEKINKIIRKEYEFDCEAYLDLAVLLINTKSLAKSPTYDVCAKIVEQYNEKGNNRKHRNLPNITNVLNSVFFHLDQLKIEKLGDPFTQLMKSSIRLGNKTGFHSALRKMKCDEASLLHKQKHNNIKTVTPRDIKFGDKFPIKAYATAIEGLLHFRASSEHIHGVIGKLLKSLVSSDGELKVLTQDKVNIDSHSLFSSIPLEVFKLFVRFAEEYSDNVFLGWCFKFMNRYYDVSSTVYDKSHEILRETAISMGNKDLLAQIDDAYKAGRRKY